MKDNAAGKVQDSQTLAILDNSCCYLLKVLGGGIKINSSGLLIEFSEGYETP